MAFTIEYFNSYIAVICKDNGEDYTRVLLHTEVRWLSKGKCLSRFHELYNSILEHMKTFDINMYSNLIKIE